MDNGLVIPRNGPGAGLLALGRFLVRDWEGLVEIQGDSDQFGIGAREPHVTSRDSGEPRGKRCAATENPRVGGSTPSLAMLGIGNGELGTGAPRALLLRRPAAGF